jgi:hypothetical protein
MSNAVYPLALDAFAVGDIDYLSDTVVAQLVGAPYVYDAAHQYAGDLTGTFATPEPVPSKSVAGGEFFGGPVVFAAVLAGDTATGLVVYVDSGTPATSRLLAFIDTNADADPLSVTTNGADITATWPSNRIFKI